MIPYSSKGRRMSKETIAKLTTQYIKDLIALIQVIIYSCDVHKIILSGCNFNLTPRYDNYWLSFIFFQAVYV